MSAAPPNAPQAPTAAKMVRLLVGAAGTGLYLGLAAWSYTAATVGDMIGAGVLLIVAFVFGIGALMLSEELGAFPRRSRLKLNCGFAVALAVLNTILFWWGYRHQPLPPIPSLSARMQAFGIQKQFAPENGEVSLRVGLRSVGNIPGITFSSAENIMFVRTYLSPEDEVREFGKVLDILRNSYSTSKEGSEVDPGEVRFTPWTGGFYANRWNDFLSGGELLYVMVAAKYTDKILPEGNYYLTEFCAVFFKGTNQFVPCPNVPTKVVTVKQ